MLEAVPGNRPGRAADQTLKVAIVHYLLVHMRGGEKVLEAICALYPDADIFTHVYDESRISPIIRRHKVLTTFVQKLPFAKRWYKYYLPFMPFAIEALDLTGYDLVISSESGPAKGIVVRPDAVHICYCHTPMRYIWDHSATYKRNAGVITRFVMTLCMPFLRVWDFASASRVDLFVANSEFIARRIRKYYRRDSVVIPPPVAVDRFLLSRANDGYYLAYGQLVSYKRFELAVAACNRLGKRLIVAGAGEEFESLKKMAGPSVEMRGRCSDDELIDLVRNCRALLFPGEEDFGIVPVEAMACGKPVIAYKAGGACETVVEGETGLFFEAQTVDSLAAAIEEFESREDSFSADTIRRHAESYREERFAEAFLLAVERAISAEKQHRAAPGTSF